MNIIYVYSFFLIQGVRSLDALSIFRSLIRSVNVSRGGILTDEFSLNALNTTTCQNLKEVAGEELQAACLSNTVNLPEAGLCQFRCRCLNNSTSFIIKDRRCLEERKFREGCQIVFGAWSWRSGWTWNSHSDPLQTLDLNSYALTAAFNVSTSNYSECKISSRSQYDSNGVWQPFTSQGNESRVVFFKFRRMWHLSWIIEEMSSSDRAKIEGRFLRFNLTCTQTYMLDEVIQSVEISSCIVFKVTGSLIYNYENVNSSLPVEPKSTAYPSKTNNDILSNGLLLGGIIGSSLLFLTLTTALVAYFLYKKQHRPRITTESHVKYNCSAEKAEPV